MRIKKSNSLLKKRFPKSFYLKYIIFLMSAIYLLSCYQPIELNNPLDPNVPWPSPTNLQILTMKETSLSIQWRENVKIFNNDQAKFVETILEQGIDGNKFSPIDTIADTVSRISINREFLSGHTYYFRVYNIVGSKTSGYSNIVSGSESSSYGPSNFKIDSISETVRKLSWQDNSTSESGFEIQRRMGTIGSFNTIAQLPANTNNYTDNSVINTDTNYTYKIFAIFNNGTVSPFDTLSIILPFPPPSNVQITSISSTSINLSWKANCSFETGFSIEKHVRGGNYTVISQLPLSSTSFTDVNLDSSLDYFYEVKALTKYNQSKNSNEIIIACTPNYINQTVFNGINVQIGCTPQPSPDGKYLFFGGYFANDANTSNYGHFRIFDTIHRTLSDEQQDGTKLSCSDFSYDDKLLATASSGLPIMIWNRNQLTLYKEILFFDVINCMVFTKDNARLITSAQDKLYSWDVNNGTLVYSTASFSQVISTLSLSPDGEIIACADGNEVQLRNSSTGSLIYTFPVFPAKVEALRFSQNGLYLAVMYDGTGVEIYNLTNYNVQDSIKIPTGNPFYFYQLFFTDDNRFIVVYVANTYNQSSTEYGIWRLSDDQLVRLCNGSEGFSIFPIQGTNMICGYWRPVFYQQLDYEWGLINK